MGRQSKLNEAQKSRVVELYDAKVKQNSIAKYFGVSPRTINRVLIEKGVIESPEMKEFNRNQFIKICEEFNMNPTSLRTKLQQPDLTYESFRTILGQLEPSQLGVLIHGAILEYYEDRINTPVAMPTEQEELVV